MNKIYTPKKIGIMAIFVSLGIVLQYVESFVLVTMIPGGKLGLANIVSVLNIFLFGGPNAIIIALIRAFIGSFLSSGLGAVPYSLTGAFLSTVTMSFVKKKFFPDISIVGICIIGATFHNIGQLLVAFLQYGTYYVFSNLSTLLILSLVSGFVTGIAAKVVLDKVFREGIL
jgi:heptaprenyl diphosphate synthase